MVYNYCALATGVHYGPYILGSLVGMVPEIFVSIYTYISSLSVSNSVSMLRSCSAESLNWCFLVFGRGIMLRTLAVASDKRHTLSVVEIVVNVLGFCVTASATIVCTVYAKKKLSAMQLDEVETA